VFPAGDHDRIGCFADQVKLTHALVRDLDEAVKEVKLLGEHGEEASQNIMELEALCKKYAEDAQKLRKEKTKLEGMVESRDELIMEITKETRLGDMGEDVEDEDEDDDNGGDTTAPPTTVPSHVPMPPATTREVIVIKDEHHVEMVSEQEGLVLHEVILADVEPELP
jgi:hypothetical protein